MRAQADRAQPVRSCCGCRERKPKGSLLRIAKGTKGLQADTEMRLPGRGVYVCSQGCFDAALRKGLLSRALSAPGSDRTWDVLRRDGVEYLSKLNEGANG